MESQKNSFCLSLLIVAICLLGSGCGTLIEGAYNAWDYNNRVDDYRDRGYSKREARQNAYDDQLLRKLDENR